MALFAGLLLTIKVARPPASQPAMSVSLLPRLFQAFSHPEPVRQARAPASRPTAPQPGASPAAPPVAAQGAAPGALPAPAPPAPAAAGLPPNLANALRRNFGCASPELYHLTADERAACDERADQMRRAARPLPVMVPPAKAAEWDAELQRRRIQPNATFTPCEGVGSNLGFGCLPPNSGHTVAKF
ncbi:MAG: hypothetical protein WDM92_01135 [Caulobacteraceae bacterium]